MGEIAVAEPHARDRAADRAIITRGEVEARLERHTLDGRTDGLAANLQGVAGQADVTDRSRSAELDRAGRTEIVENTTRPAGPVEAGEGKHLAADEPACLVGVHHPGHR